MALLTIPLSAAFKFWQPGIPFMHRMGWVTLVLTALMVVIGLASNPDKLDKRFVDWEAADFKPGSVFVLGSVFVMGALSALYAVYW